MSEGLALALACVLIPTILLLFCLLALCIAIGKFVNHIQSQIPEDEERSVIVEIDVIAEEVQETAV